MNNKRKIPVKVRGMASDSNYTTQARKLYTEDDYAEKIFNLNCLFRLTKLVAIEIVVMH